MIHGREVHTSFSAKQQAFIEFVLSEDLGRETRGVFSGFQRYLYAEHE
jgi:hypothetical protein